MNEEDDLSPARIRSMLRAARYGQSCDVKEVTDSTNDDARKAASEGAPDGHVVVANQQRRGRGSRGREWSSPRGEDLYLSVVAHVALAPRDLSPLTLAAGLAVAETADVFTSRRVRAEVKWPNDVWLQARKVAGILVETASVGSESLPAVIGIGLNVNRTEFPAGFDTEATSLCCARGGEKVDRGQVLATLLERLEHWVDRFLFEGPAPVIAAMSQRLALRGQPVWCDDKQGILDGLTAAGALRLQTHEGPREVCSGRLRAALQTDSACKPP